MIKLTEKKALEICLELWEWLAETGSDNKGAWLRWKEYKRCLFGCPICEYRVQHGFMDSSIECPDCLLYWRAKPNLKNRCTYKDSPFEKWWVSSSPRTRKKYALQIVQLAKDALEKLEGE